jgi:hypothetical protein
MSDNKPEQRQTFLSKLRQRSTIIFTIGLAISVASFVESLHMGRDAINFVVNELAKVEGWEDFVRATAAIFHGALEWWRGVARDLLTLLPFEVPQWLHDPISVTFFAVSRLISGLQRRSDVALYPGWDIQGHNDRLRLRALAWRSFGPMFAAMTGAAILDATLYAPTASTDAALATNVALLLLVVALAFLATRSISRKYRSEPAAWGD